MTKNPFSNKRARFMINMTNNSFLTIYSNLTIIKQIPIKLNGTQ